MCMLNSLGHLGPLSSVSLSPVCVIGGKGGEHGKTFRCSSNAGQAGTGAGGTLEVEVPGKYC